VHYPTFFRTPAVGGYVFCENFSRVGKFTISEIVVITPFSVVDEDPHPDSQSGSRKEKIPTNI
jgi:hypothetical protein